MKNNNIYFCVGGQVAKKSRDNLYGNTSSMSVEDVLFPEVYEQLPESYSNGKNYSSYSKKPTDPNANYPGVQHIVGYTEEHIDVEISPIEPRFTFAKDTSPSSYEYKSLSKRLSSYCKGS